MTDTRTVDVAGGDEKPVRRGYLVSSRLVSIMESELTSDQELWVRGHHDSDWSQAYRIWHGDSHDRENATEVLLRVDDALVDDDARLVPVHRIDWDCDDVDGARVGRDDRAAQYGPDHQQTVVAAVNLAIAARNAGRDEPAALTAAAHSVTRVWGDGFVSEADISDIAGLAEPTDPYVVHRMLLLAVRSHDDPVLAVLRYEWLRAAAPLGDAQELIARHLEAIAAETTVMPESPEVLNARFDLAEQCASVDAPSAVELFGSIVSDSEQAEVYTEKTIRAHYLLGIVLATRGKLRQAVATMEQVLEDYEQVCGAESAPACDARARLADIHMQRQDARSAIPHLEWFVHDDGTLRDRASGPPESVRFELAIAYRTAGQVTRALPLLQRLVSEIDAGIHDDPHEVVTVRHELAKVHEIIGDWDNAIPLYERARADSEALLAADDPLVVITANDTARAWAENGQVDRARESLRQLATDSQRLHGEDHVLTAIVARNLDGLTDQSHTV